MAPSQSSAANQRLTATVTHTLWKISKQVFVESYRILHDQTPEDAIFEGERSIRNLAVVDQPRLGPLMIFRRPLEMSADDARLYFSGNTSPYVSHYDPRDGAPIRPAPQTQADRETPGAREGLEHRLRSMELQRTAIDAPGSIADDDLLWDPNNLHDWYGVRYIQSIDGQLGEVLQVVSLEYACIPRGDCAWEILEALGVQQDAIVLMEYQNAAVHMNNRKLFQIRRRARLTDDEYVERYIGLRLT